MFGASTRFDSKATEIVTENSLSIYRVSISHRTSAFISALSTLHHANPFYYLIMVLAMAASALALSNK